MGQIHVIERLLLLIFNPPQTNTTLYQTWSYFWFDDVGKSLDSWIEHPMHALPLLNIRTVVIEIVNIYQVLTRSQALS